MNMGRKTFVVVILMGSVFTAACTSAAPAATSTPTPSATATLVPTDTATATATATQTPIPSETPTAAPTDTPEPLVASTALSEWRGLPVMPGAYDVTDSGSSYGYRIDEDINVVQAYYESKMSNLGWDLIGSGEAAEGGGLFLYMKDGVLATITIAKPPDASYVIVILLI